jgi:transposase InsO family protein
VYKGHRVRQRRAIDEAAVVELVKRERRIQPKLGGRKLLVVVGRALEDMGIRIGRDRFFELLRDQGLLIARTRRGGPRTTDARHRFRTYPNLIRGLELTGPHQAWVSDITYVRTEEGWVYVYLISDAYSRKIVGHVTGDTLEARWNVRALGMAVAQLPRGAHPIHHSDRGIQYCCDEYVEALESLWIRISMTEEDHCYENAMAERVNGILKQEYGLGETLKTRREAREALEEGVRLFNERRPHVSLGYETPSKTHGGSSRRSPGAAGTPVALRAPSVPAAPGKVGVHVSRVST